MGGKNIKSRRYRFLQNPHHKICDATGLSSVEEDDEATYIAKRARKPGKRGVAQRRKGQEDPDFQIRPNSDKDVGGRTKESQDRGLWQGKKKKLRYHYTIHDDRMEEEEEDEIANVAKKASRKHGRRGAAQHKNSGQRYYYTRHDDATEEEEEGISEYNTAEEGDNEEDAEEILTPENELLPSYLFAENGAQEDGARNQKTRVILRQLQELLAHDDLDDAEVPPVGSIEPSAEKSCAESTKRVNTSDQTTKLDGRGRGFPRLADSDKENTFGNSAQVESDGQGEDTLSQVSAQEESTKASTDAERSSGGSWLFGLIRKPFKLWSQKFVEGDNIPVPKSESLSISQKEPRKIQVALREKQQRRQKWSEKSTKRFQLSTMGYYFDGEIIDHKMYGYGRLVLEDGDCIAGNWNASRLIDLKFSQLLYRQKTYSIVKRQDDYLLTIYEYRFVAIVELNSIYEIDFTKSIGQIKQAFLAKLSPTVILQDELTNRRKESLCEFEVLLKNMTEEYTDPNSRANIFIILRKYSADTPNKKLSDFLDDPNVPSELKNAAINLQTRDSEYRSLNNSATFLKNRVVQLDLMNIIANIYKDRIENYRRMLVSRCSSRLPNLISKLGNLDDSKIIYITRSDMDVFDQLASQPFFQHYEGCVENLVERFGQAFDKVLAYHPSEFFDTTLPAIIIPIMSPILEFLAKSLFEIISEIIEAAEEYQYEDLLVYDSGQWEIQEEIKWPEEQDHNTQEDDMVISSKPSENKSYYRRSLEIQYKLIFDILKRVFPDRYILNKRLDYKFCVLEQDSFQENVEVATTNLRPGLLMIRETRELPERFKDLSEERLVWLYILDQTIHEVFKDDPQYRHVLKRYDPLLQGAVRFVESSPTESQESFRALIHSVVKLVMSSAPYIRATADQPGEDAEDKLGIDVEILFEQISTACQNIDHDQLAFSNFRDLIIEFNKYLSLRHFIEVKAAPGYFSSQLSQMLQTFMRIVETSLKKSVPTTALVSYFRCLNDFVDDFRNIDFLGMWYVKTMGFDNQEAMKKVDNKLSTCKNCSYLVTDIDKFVAEYQCLDLPPPHHYIIQIVHELLRCIEKCLDKQWQSDDDQLQLVQLKTAGTMLDATRRSFMYLKEQPDYVDFKAFRKESVDPFARLVDECSTLNDLKNRANIVKESFWYLRKMDEIDIDQAMILLRDSNTCKISDKLLNCYNLYLSSYNEYIETYTSFISCGNSQEGLEDWVLDAVKQMLKEARPLHFSEWTEEFKTEEIPILLAGLSAVWSILVSKDLSGTGKFLKPHCIQILCILRLLSVDESTGTDNHLAQVLTGQGKSVILGLLSSVLALTGHKVRVLCYSKYLSSRDEDDFEDFFQTFEIYGKINYGTFEDMANEFLTPTYNEKRKSLRQLVEDTVRNHASWSAMGSVTTESKNTVLLIDEVDVFFTENFYGNTYRSGVHVKFSGLAAVQEKIWSLATKKQFTEQEIVDHIKAFISNEAAASNTVLFDLNVFLSTPGTFSLLKSEDGNLIVKDYTNQSLFDEHLLEMISDAVSVAGTSYDHRATPQFKINSEGIICGRTSDNIYKEEWSSHRYWRYLNTFNYFRLKGSNYDHKNFQNYGYLNLDTGRISYSLLPSQFRLILGVSGTIKNLGEYETTGIKSYNIHNTTILPSFYGESNLLFNLQNDFHYYAEEQEWLKEIYYRASSILLSNRAVLIFFESDLVIDLFTKEYKTKFDRLNEITTNTVAHLRDIHIIEEAGLPGAVTLATRGMGRGVDYKSSLSVEKHGGVHVIQTFFSTDIKEEIQIKGRTARKDNKGSYEIIICNEHLVKESIISAHDRNIYTYAKLDEIRQNLSAEKGRTVIDKINSPSATSWSRLMVLEGQEEPAASAH